MLSVRSTTGSRGRSLRSSCARANSHDELAQAAEQLDQTNPHWTLIHHPLWDRQARSCPTVLIFVLESKARTRVVSTWLAAARRRYPSRLLTIKIGEAGTPLTAPTGTNSAVQD